LIKAEFQRGENDARADIGARAMRYFFQTRGAWGEKFTELMRERFGVHVVHISDMTCDANQSYQQGYNSTIESHLDQAFGKGAFDRTWAEIEAYRQENYVRWAAARRRSGG
jgi:hypothetical protein